jgi:tRNA A37 threonylcarbamoyladenosine biosynthesis protein TsaE
MSGELRGAGKRPGRSCKGLVTLAGEVGAGKTTLLNRLLNWLHKQQTRTAFLFNSRMNTSQVL